MIVGLTGGIGSGKSEAAQMFAKLGTPIVDVDVIAHQLTNTGSEAHQAIIKAFGKTYQKSDGSLDRAMLREKIFTDDAARQKLEGILHPAIHKQALLELSGHAKTPYQILVIPLLFEGGRYQDTIHRTLVIDCEESTQIARARLRSGLSNEVIIAIMRAQVSREKRLALADDVIENNGSLVELSVKVEKIHKKYMQTCIVSE